MTIGDRDRPDAVARPGSVRGRRTHTAGHPAWPLRSNFQIGRKAKLQP
jgi:hypothetical protein